jgi:LPS-assembly lipoprotein
MAVRNVFVLLALSMLAACGFHLRNQSSLPSALEPIYIGGKVSNGALANALRYQLRNNDTKVATNSATANYKLILLAETHEQRIISLDRRGLAAEYGLISAIEFELLDRSGQHVLGPLKLQEMRTVTNNPDNALTTSQEITLVQDDIDKALAALVVRRLGAFANHLPVPAASSTSEPPETPAPSSTDGATNTQPTIQPPASPAP